MRTVGLLIAAIAAADAATYDPRWDQHPLEPKNIPYRACGSTTCHALPTDTATIPAAPAALNACSHVTCSAHLHKCSAHNLGNAGWAPHPDQTYSKKHAQCQWEMVAPASGAAWHSAAGQDERRHATLQCVAASAVTGTISNTYDGEECDGTTDHWSIKVSHSNDEQNCGLHHCQIEDVVGGGKHCVCHAMAGTQSCVGLKFANGNDVCSTEGCGGAAPFVSLSHGGCSADAATWAGNGCDTTTCQAAAEEAGSQSCVGLTFANGNNVCSTEGCSDAAPFVSLAHGGCSGDATTWTDGGCDTTKCQEAPDNSGRCYKIIKRAYKNNAHLRVTYAYLKEAGLTKSDFSTQCYDSSIADSLFGGTNKCGSKHGLKTYWWTYVAGGITYPAVPGSCCNGNQQLRVSTVPDAMCDGDYEMTDVQNNKFAADSSAVLPGGDVGDVSSCQECANKCAKVPGASVFIINGNPANTPGVSGAGTCAALATMPGTCHCYGAARYNQLQADAKHITGKVLTHMTTLGCQGQGSTQPNPCPSGTW